MYDFAIILLLAYFLPTIIAVVRDHQSRMAICAVNLLFGWTMAGWFLAFIWSLTGVRENYRGARLYRREHLPPYRWR